MIFTRLLWLLGLFTVHSTTLQTRVTRRLLASQSWQAVTELHQCRNTEAIIGVLNTVYSQYLHQGVFDVYVKAATVRAQLQKMHRDLPMDCTGILQHLVQNTNEIPFETATIFDEFIFMRSLLHCALHQHIVQDAKALEVRLAAHHIYPIIPIGYIIEYHLIEKRILHSKNEAQMVEILTEYHPPPAVCNFAPVIDLYYAAAMICESLDSNCNGLGILNTLLEDDIRITWINVESAELQKVFGALINSALHKHPPMDIKKELTTKIAQIVLKWQPKQPEYAFDYTELVGNLRMELAKLNEALPQYFLRPLIDIKFDRRS
eukprot:308971_1